MDEKILKEYEKIKDQLSQEEFLAEMENLRENYEDVDFMNDTDIAHMVVNNYIDENEDFSQNDENLSQDTISTDKKERFRMSDEILEKYDKVKDEISQEEFLKRMEEINKKENNPFMTDDSLADMVVGEFINEKNDILSEKEEYSTNTISKLEIGKQDVNISGRVISISNPKKFTTRKGGKGQVCNVELADNTGNIRIVFWTQNIPLLKNFSEGDLIQIKNLDIKEGYSGNPEANMRPRSSIIHLKNADESQFPPYEENITDIADIIPDSKVNIIARIIRIPPVREYEKNGKTGQVTSLELQDKSGKISYTLWNKNVDLIEDLELHDGDTIKILAAQANERNGEISLTHWDGRIIKGDYDAPELVQEISKIGDLSEEKDVSILGVVSKLQDVKTFERKTDGSEGKLRNFDVLDDTGSIRVTVWGNDTELPINKGDVVKIIGGEVRFDDYTSSGYSMNTGFNTQITINPDNLSIEEKDLFDKLKEQLRPITIGQIAEMDDDGLEVDVVGRIISISDENQFQRDDGSVGIVRSAVFADETGKVQLSFWDAKAQKDYEIGAAYQIENARTRLGMYDVDLNIGGASRVIKLTDEEASARFIPELSTLEKMIYAHMKIGDIEDEDEDNIIVLGRIIEVYDIREFDRDTGDRGHVRNIELADDTGSIRVVLWDNDAKKDFKVGEAIKLQNPRITYNEDHLELTVSRNTSIINPSDEELKDLPSHEELIEEIYVEKTIESLTEDDRNVRITGILKDISSDRTILRKCPHCNNNLDQFEENIVCDYCGEEIEEPKYLLMIPARFSDDTGEISITFFDKLAEELIGMKKEEIIDIVEDGYGIEDKVEDLEGLTLEIIADVSFDEYNEENRLRPKKILSKTI